MKKEPLYIWATSETRMIVEAFAKRERRSLSTSAEILIEAGAKALSVTAEASASDKAGTQAGR